MVLRWPKTRRRTLCELRNDNMRRVRPSNLQGSRECTLLLVACLGLSLAGGALPAASPGGRIDTVHPHSFYWHMAGASTSTAEAGFSFFTRIFSLFDPKVGGVPAGMQMGLGGTWLTPTNISWAALPKDVCACNPKGWPSATKGDQAFGCCEKDTRCSFLFETFEGGPGYWIGMLPTATPKWRVNSAVGCYKSQTATPLFNFGAVGAPHQWWKQLQAIERP